ncbi:MAG: hypothetical protein ACPL7B_06300 [Candidatus Poribacteria bacterium]
MKYLFFFVLLILAFFFINQPNAEIVGAWLFDEGKKMLPLMLLAIKMMAKLITPM